MGLLPSRLAPDDDWRRGACETPVLSARRRTSDRGRRYLSAEAPDQGDISRRATPATSSVEDRRPLGLLDVDFRRGQLAGDLDKVDTVKGGLGLPRPATLSSPRPQPSRSRGRRLVHFEARAVGRDEDDSSAGTFCKTLRCECTATPAGQPATKDDLFPGRRVRSPTLPAKVNTAPKVQAILLTPTPRTPTRSRRNPGPWDDG